MELLFPKTAMKRYKFGSVMSRKRPVCVRDTHRQEIFIKQVGMRHRIISQKENKNIEKVVLTTWGSIKKKKELAEILIKKAKKAISDLGRHIIVQDAAAPKTFERYTFMSEGAIYAFDQSIGTKKPYFKTPAIKGLPYAFQCP